MKVKEGDVKDVAHMDLVYDPQTVTWQAPVLDAAMYSLAKVLDRVSLAVPDARKLTPEELEVSTAPLPEEYAARRWPCGARRRVG